VVGSSNTDLVLQCARLPRPGETLSGGEFARYAGGKGANQAVAAARAGARVSFVGMHGRDDFGRAARAGLRREGIEAFLLPDTNVLPPLLTELAARHRLPTIYGLSGMVTDLGGLAAYSTQANSFEDVVGYAVRILRGERPADLPVQESTRFEFILNAKAARDLGLTFPASLLLRANQVVEK